MKKIGYFSEIGILRTIAMILRFRNDTVILEVSLKKGRGEVVKNNAKFTPECAVLYIIKIQEERMFLKDGKQD